MKTTITVNAAEIARKYKLIATALPRVVDGVIEDTIKQVVLPPLDKTVGTWERKPRFTAEPITGGWGARISPLYPWEYLNRGTRVRYANLSRDWKSKTKPNVIGSFRGSGRVLFISRRHPRPGIQARNWQDMIFRRATLESKRRLLYRLKQEASYRAGVGY